MSVSAWSRMGASLWVQSAASGSAGPSSRHPDRILVPREALVLSLAPSVCRRTRPAAGGATGDQVLPHDRSDIRPYGAAIAAMVIEDE